MNHPDIFGDVIEFMEGPDRGRNINPEVGWPKDDRVLNLRMNLIREEMAELEQAVAAGNLVETLDAVIDLIYVTAGFCGTLGVDGRPLWREVHRSNMVKVGAPDRTDGKILKPEGWTPPDIEENIRPLRRPITSVHPLCFGSHLKATPTPDRFTTARVWECSNRCGATWTQEEMAVGSYAPNHVPGVRR